MQRKSERFIFDRPKSDRKAKAGSNSYYHKLGIDNVPKLDRMLEEARIADKRRAERDRADAEGRKARGEWIDWDVRDCMRRKVSQR